MTREKRGIQNLHTKATSHLFNNTTMGKRPTALGLAKVIYNSRPSVASPAFGASGFMLAVMSQEGLPPESLYPAGVSRE